MGRNCWPCYYYITATALVLSFSALVPQRVRSAGIFELDLVSLANSDGREVSGGCCSGRRPDGACPLNCSVYLHVCITHYMREVEVKGDCTFFQFQTQLFQADPHSGEYDVRAQERASFLFQIRWPGQFSIIVDAWHPAETEGSGKTLVRRFVSQRTLDAGPEWTLAEMRASRNAELAVKFRVVCAQNYFGADCATFCRPRDDINGHYTCNGQGQKVCLDGWTNFSEEPRFVLNQTYTLPDVLALPLTNKTDDYCRIAVCEPKCLMGQCDSPGVCRCWQGWKGSTCSQCEAHPGCKHGYCENKPFTCFCNEGWGGMTCDRDLNICTTKKPCEHGATCTNNAHGDDLYNCTCTEDFMGKRCEIHKNPCQTNPCENGGTCKNPSVGQYTCECVPGYFGQRCDTFAVICKDNQCLNGGTCIHDPEGFKCACAPGFKGINCDEIDSINCLAYPCLNGGTCVNSSNNFQCLCPPGVTGAQCEVARHCSPITCQNGGTCAYIHGNVTCHCPTGYSGTHCQVNNNRCSTNPCANQATCVNLADDYRCDCPPGYSGRSCETHSRCHPNPCGEGGSCHPAPSEGYKCHCLVGYHGDRCQLKNLDWSPSVASNVSHRISEEEEDQPEDRLDVILVVGLSAVSVVIILVGVCAVWCLLHRRRKRHPPSVEPPLPKGKDFDYEERLQNERNTLHMNYKQCDMPQKIVNDLDRVPIKQINEAPPKVLNKEVGNKRIPDKSLICSSRTFQKIDNSCGASVRCHSPRDYPPCNSGAIYIIEDHLRSCPDPRLKKEILATEV